MNIHVMLLLLTLHPIEVKPMPLIEAPQVSAPIDVYEDKAKLQDLKDMNHILKLLKERS